MTTTAPTTAPVPPMTAEAEAARVELTRWISCYVTTDTGGGGYIHPLKGGLEIDGKHIEARYLWDNVCRYVALSEKPLDQWTEAAKQRLPGILVELYAKLAKAEGEK
jgi:hypothetical protein